ncbi:alpha-ketoglutarate-dependent dioxygenase AlkB family protein [Lyngbya confervoides]|uniref:Alpha-ketoglutarate-dependent dioxygenase AlkB n=1 Tax=Lyngbya confervoides BDU141951 TaxID=1574623 RepID=A0ABD4SZD5_9CYAN|nr:alpha-ketoglutarate-dependent dioxygenase AlkB [Lyngbya confervoides]MCM1981510.1 alpha-ketoglutarate-dependent dioxygenase AlkB [Lyngbya confervoides BDU141951]
MNDRPGRQNYSSEDLREPGIQARVTPEEFFALSQGKAFSPAILEAEDVPPLVYWPGFLPKAQADRLLTLSLDLPWQQQQITIFGKQRPVPRLESYFGDSTAYHYGYSNSVSWQAAPWPDFLADLRSQVEVVTGYAYQVGMGNLYRDGNDSNGYHADDEPELGEDPAIASVSLGATRTFRLKRRKKGAKSWGIALHHGDLLLMQPGCQRNWIHTVPKTARPCGPRINWTFRPYVSLTR